MNEIDKGDRIIPSTIKEFPSGAITWSAPDIQINLYGITSDNPKYDAFDTSKGSSTHLLIEPSLQQLARFEAAALTILPDSAGTKALSKIVNDKMARLREELAEVEAIRIKARGGNTKHLNAQGDTD